MKKSQKGQGIQENNLTEQEANKKIAMWESEKLILKLLLQCIVGNYRICIDSSDGIKVWIENETPETKLDDKNKTKLIQELVRHIK